MVLCMKQPRRASSPPMYAQAILCYFRSLDAAQTQIQRGTIDIHVALISCTLFIRIETLQGHTTEATQLYQQGVKMLDIILSSQPEKGSTYSVFLEQIIAIYDRLRTVSYITVVPTPVQSL